MMLGTDSTGEGGLLGRVGFTSFLGPVVFIVLVDFQRRREGGVSQVLYLESSNDLSRLYRSPHSTLQCALQKRTCHLTSVYHRRCGRCCTIRTLCKR